MKTAPARPLPDGGAPFWNGQDRAAAGAVFQHQYPELDEPSGPIRDRGRGAGQGRPFARRPSTRNGVSTDVSEPALHPRANRDGVRTPDLTVSAECLAYSRRRASWSSRGNVRICRTWIATSHRKRGTPRSFHRSRGNGNSRPISPAAPSRTPDRGAGRVRNTASWSSHRRRPRLRAFPRRSRRPSTHRRQGTARSGAAPNTATPRPPSINSDGRRYPLRMNQPAFVTITEVLPLPAAATTRTLSSSMTTALRCSSVSGRASTRSKNSLQRFSSLATKA